MGKNVRPTKTTKGGFPVSGRPIGPQKPDNPKDEPQRYPGQKGKK